MRGRNLFRHLAAAFAAALIGGSLSTVHLQAAAVLTAAPAVCDPVVYAVCL